MFSRASSEGPHKDTFHFTFKTLLRHYAKWTIGHWPLSKKTWNCVPNALIIRGIIVSVGLMVNYKPSCGLSFPALISTVYYAPARYRWTWWGGWGCWWAPRTRGRPWRAAPAGCWCAVSAGSSGCGPRPAPGPGSGCGGCWRWTAGTWRRCWGSSSLSSSSSPLTILLSAAIDPSAAKGFHNHRDCSSKPPPHLE